MDYGFVCNFCGDFKLSNVKKEVVDYKSQHRCKFVFTKKYTIARPPLAAFIDSEIEIKEKVARGLTVIDEATKMEAGNGQL